MTRTRVHERRLPVESLLALGNFESHVPPIRIGIPGVYQIFRNVDFEASEHVDEIRERGEVDIEGAVYAFARYLRNLSGQHAHGRGMVFVRMRVGTAVGFVNLSPSARRILHVEVARNGKHGNRFRFGVEAREDDGIRKVSPFVSGAAHSGYQDVVLPA